ncbi:MAG: sce7726 family protein [Bacteroidia bacterium]
MNTKTSYHIDQLRDYSTLFLRSEVNRWLNNDFKSIDLKIKRYDSSLIKNDFNYLSYLKYIYKILEKHYPNEYIYKNEFLNKWLIKELGNSDSIIVNEFRIGKAIADLVMFNGTSRVFEIKTILDKEYRLTSQLLEYKKIFNEIYLIIPKSSFEKYSNYDNSIGIITYDSNIKDFYLFRKPIQNIEINSDSLMNVLHTNEYKEIVKDYYGELPSMNDFTQFEICKELISNIPNEKLNKLFIKTVKKRKLNNVFFNNINNELNQICLSLNLSNDQKTKLIEKLKSKIVY